MEITTENTSSHLLNDTKEIKNKGSPISQVCGAVVWLPILVATKVSYHVPIIAIVLY